MAKKRGREVLPLNKHLLEGRMHTCKPDSPRLFLSLFREAKYTVLRLLGIALG